VNSYCLVIGAGQGGLTAPSTWLGARARSDLAARVGVGMGPAAIAATDMHNQLRS